MEGDVVTPREGRTAPRAGGRAASATRAGALALLLTLALGAAPAFGDGGVVVDPDDGGDQAGLDTTSLRVDYSQNAITVTAHGDYDLSALERVDLSVTTPGYGNCWDLRSLNPGHAGKQRHVLFANECGSFEEVRCRKARIKGSSTRFRLVIPQSCMRPGPRRLNVTLSFSATDGRYSQIDFGPFHRG